MSEKFYRKVIFVNYYDYKIADNLAVIFMKLEVWCEDGHK